MLASLTVIPVGETPGLCHCVAAMLHVIRESGLPHRVCALSTEIEGEWDEVMAVVKAAHEVGRSFTGRVMTHITIEDREGHPDRLHGKLAELEEALGGPLADGSGDNG